jgi:hypothetical protein
VQGNSSANDSGADRCRSTSTTSATRAARVLFLNYSAVDPILTNEKCSFWHFRFDAHADMRMAALMEVLKDDKAVQIGLPDRAGLQLRPGRAARGAAPAGRAAAGCADRG